ncbi:MAG: hypothetical protein ABIJ97_03200 [Bacteroidota bacterium]
MSIENLPDILKNAMVPGSKYPYCEKCHKPVDSWGKEYDILITDFIIRYWGLIF